MESYNNLARHAVCYRTMWEATVISLSLTLLYKFSSSDIRASSSPTSLGAEVALSGAVHSLVLSLLCQ